MNENAKRHFEKMFPHLQSSFAITDPDFYHMWHNFMYDEVVNSDDLSDRMRMMCILASCIGTQGLEEFKSMIRASYQLGVTPVEIKEIVYQAVPFCGIAKVLPFLIETNSFLKSQKIDLPLEKQSKTNEENRYQRGKEIIEEIHGINELNYLFNKNHIMNKWIIDNCYGDFYTRGGLNIKERELMTFCYLSAMGENGDLLRKHIQANIRLGNDIVILNKVVSQCLPFIGYINAIKILERLESI